MLLRIKLRYPPVKNLKGNTTKQSNLPPDADIDSVKSNYKNGILEITFNKKVETKGKEVKVD